MTTDPQDIMASLQELVDVNRDTMESLRLEWDAKWGTERFDVPGKAIDFGLIYEEVLMDCPEIINSVTNGPLTSNSQIEEVMGRLSEPFVDYVNMIRKYIVLHNVNLYVKLGYLELIFEAESLSETYKLSDKARAELSDDILAAMEKLIELHKAFSNRA